MKWKGFLLVGLLLSSLLLWGVYPKGDYKEKESLILDAVLNYLNALHFSPLELNDEFSNQVFDNYLEAVDPSKRFLLQSEVDQLSIYKDDLDDQIKMKDFEFFNASLDIIDLSRARAEKVFKEIIAGDLSQIDEKSVEMDREKRPYSQNDAELKDLWEQLIKYDFNNRLLDKISQQEADKEEMDGDMEKMKDGEMKNVEMENKDADKDEAPKTMDELKADITERIQETYEDWFDRMDQDKRSDRFETYINSITHLFDPHSDFYNPKEKQDFDIRMGGKLEGIGARLQTDGDLSLIHI